MNSVLAAGTLSYDDGDEALDNNIRIERQDILVCYCIYKLVLVHIRFPGPRHYLVLILQQRLLILRSLLLLVVFLTDCQRWLQKLLR